MRKEDENKDKDLSGLLVMARCIQIEDQLYTVIIVRNKARRRLTVTTPRFLSPYPIKKGLRSQGDYVNSR
jgi:hypothetical protein